MPVAKECHCPKRYNRAKAFAVLFLSAMLAGCGVQAQSPDAGFVEGAHGAHSSARQWVLQEELPTVMANGCCGADFQDVLDRRVQFNRVYEFSAPVQTDQITLTYRCRDCNLVLWILVDSQTGEYLADPLILQGTVNATLTVPTNHLVHGVRLNVTSTGGGESELLAMGEQLR
jgi:hypothetical protein